MKKLLFLTFLFVGCSSDTVPTSENFCSCKAYHYTRHLNGWNGSQPVYEYTQISVEPARQMDCDLDNGEYLPLNNGTFFKIVCN